MAMIFLFSSIAQAPAMPHGVDKELHGLLYGGLGALLVRALAGGWRRRVTMGVAVGAMMIAAAYGITDEIHQHFVPPRHAEALDVAADTTGAALVAAGLFLWSRLRWASRESRPV